MSETGKPQIKRIKLAKNVKDESTDQAALESLLQELENLQKVLSNILDEAQEYARQSIKDFVEDKVRKMGAMIGHYYTAFQKLNVMSRKDMGEAIKKMYNYESIRDAEEELFQLEDNWNSFLEEIDCKIDPSSVKEAKLCSPGPSSIVKKTKPELTVGSHGPCELKLTDVSTERQCSLQDLLTSTSTVLILLRHFA